MSNPNYVKGRAYEYQVMKDWAKHGYICMRTSGSHGHFDVIAVKPGGAVELIQCKTTETLSTAHRMVEEFHANPPLPPGDYHQRLSVKIKGGEELGCVV